VSAEAIAAVVVYVAIAVFTGVIWFQLSKSPDPTKLPRELQFRLWVPEGAEVVFCVLAGILCPISFPALFAWCMGWFLVVGIIESVREYLPERVPEASINRPSAYPFGL
jgi:hypothetical protein